MPQVVRYGEHDDQFVHVYKPTSDPVGTVVSIHGGYWRAKYGLDLNAPMAEHLSSNGWRVLNVEYRRVEPDSTGVWPDMAADIVAACQLAEDTGPTVLLGHSAGGHLALWAAAQGAVKADSVVALAPVSDLFLADGLELSDHATAALLGTTAAERPDLYAEASPMYLLPLGVPQLVVHGKADDAVPPEMSIDYVEAARGAGDAIELVDPKKVDHFHIIDPAHQVWRSVDHFLAKLVG